ncbi:MAG: UDP-glucose dehydrogenase family protein [Dehalococcoidia bacterium]
MRVTIVGMGCVGLTSAVALDYLGHQVSCVDRDEGLIKRLLNGELPVHEPVLHELWNAAHIEVTSRLLPASASADILIIAVGTPVLPDGHADISAVRSVAKEVAEIVPDEADTIVAIKSTVPPGTTNIIQQLIDGVIERRKCTARVTVASNPEFLRQASALADTLYPDRIVLGTRDRRSLLPLLELYASLIQQQFCPPRAAPRPQGYSRAPVIATRPIDAELIKYAANAFLVTKLSFVNELAGLAEQFGADISEVTKGIGLDHRIGPHYLNAGPGWGGPCLGKDARALLALAADQQRQMPLLSAALTVNAHQRQHIVDRLEEALGSVEGTTIGILGLAFKSGTADVTDSPALGVMSLLLQRGARVRCYDPVAERKTMEEYPELPIEYHDSVKGLSKGCDALVLMTDWEEFKQQPWTDLARVMKRKTLVDTRNFLDSHVMEQAGFIYMGIGR